MNEPNWTYIDRVRPTRSRSSTRPHPSRLIAKVIPVDPLGEATSHWRGQPEEGDDEGGIEMASGG